MTRCSSTRSRSSVTAAPRELKLGTFKLAGLNDVSLIDEKFEAMHGLYDQGDSKYKGVTLFAVEPESAAA